MTWNCKFSLLVIGWVSHTQEENEFYTKSFDYKYLKTMLYCVKQDLDKMSTIITVNSNRVCKHCKKGREWSIVRLFS